MSEPADVTALTPQECRDLFAGQPVARVAFSDADGALHVLPVTHAVVGDDVCFKSAPGTKLGRAAAGGRMVVQSDAVDDTGQTGWSVVARGNARIVTDEDELEVLMALPFQPWSHAAEEGLWVRVDVDQWEGRRVAH